MGLKFETIVSPPFASAIICPQLKDNCVISVDSQHMHLDLPISSPILVFHTSLFTAAEIFFFFTVLHGFTFDCLKSGILSPELEISAALPADRY